MSLGNAKFVEGCLQTAVAEKRDLNCAVSSQWLLEKLIDARLGATSRGIVGDLDDVLVQLGVSDGLCSADAAVSRKGRAAAEYNGDTSEKREATNGSRRSLVSGSEGGSHRSHC
ncbi:hypothetical protein ACFPN9_21985 [Bosea massiliensis]|uniref:Uncharacterized protein n=1 Tax=Bosea massiliensis TaxID=151419 RepID=A0ABW0P833_9HYPH